jgi:uncharacterized OB-fold protein
MSGKQKISPAAPEADADSRFFWDGLRQKKLLIQRCGDCGRSRFPPMPRCPYCASAQSSVLEAGGGGTIYTWVVVHRAFDPAFEDEVPFTLATVDLDEGARIVGRLEGAPPRFGMRVQAAFFHHPNWTELRFAPQGSK